MRPLAVCLLAILVLAVLPSATGREAGVASGWEARLLVGAETATPAKRFEAFDTASLNLFDFDLDGTLEIVSANDNNHVYVLSSTTGAILAEIVTTHPGGDSWGARELNGIAIGNLRGDGVPCLVVPNSASYLSAWCLDRAASAPGNLSFVREWEVFVDAAAFEPDFAAAHPWIRPGEGPGMDGNAWLANVDDDEALEVFVQTDGKPGQFSFDSDGAYRWSRSWFDGNGGPVVADLDGRGGREVVFTSDSGNVACFDARTGGFRWVFDAGAFVSPGSIPVSATVADLSGDGPLEVVFGARGANYSAEDPQWINRSHAAWFAVDHAGKLLWMAQHEWMNPLTYNHPVAVDVDRDGVLDVVALDWNTIGHKPGNWETTNRSSNLFALNGRDGSLLWRLPVDVRWSNKDLVVLDADGDGDLDVILNEADRASGRDGLSVVELSDGARRGSWTFPAGWGASRGPVAADTDGDGTTELVVPLWRADPSPNYRSLDVGHREGALLVVATGRAMAGPATGNVLFAPGHDWVRGDLGEPVPRIEPPPKVNESRPDSPTEWNQTPAEDEPVLPPAAGEGARGRRTPFPGVLVALVVLAGAAVAVRRKETARAGQGAGAPHMRRHPR